MDEPPMNISPNVRRRRAQLVLLTAAVVMILLGFTVFAKWLNGGIRLLAYCLICLGLTLTAMLLAARDMRDIRRQNREERLGLMEKAFDGVSAEVKEARDKRRANRPN